MELISSIQQRIFISAMDLFRSLILHLHYTTATGKVNVPIIIIIVCHKTCICEFVWNSALIMKISLNNTHPYKYLFLFAKIITLCRCATYFHYDVQQHERLISVNLVDPEAEHNAIFSF